MNLPTFRDLARWTLLGTMLIGTCAVADVSSYPVKPIRIIVSFPPGGGTDLLNRLVGQKLTEKWGQPVVVDNRSSAGGIIGARAAASAQPDGYTLYGGAFPHLILGPHLFENLPFNTTKDFMPVISLASQHVMLVVHPSVPAQTMKEFIALAKAKPGHYNFSSAGNGSSGHLTGMIFQALTGVKLTHIPYKGSGPAIVELLSGRDVALSFASMTIVPHIKTGKVRALAITSTSRSGALPDVPTAAEAGLKDFLVDTWNGVFVPVGTSREMIMLLNSEIGRILRRPDVLEALAALGVSPTGGTPEQFAATIREDLVRWGKVIRDVGIPKEKL
jgi:tripartite-type tricarboxylate transporter receptor subunit TctC